MGVKNPTQVHNLTVLRGYTIQVADRISQEIALT